MIALIAAVSQETSILRNLLHEKVAVGPLQGLRGLLEGEEVILLHSGIGKVSAAVAATLLIESFRPRLILSMGCGGAYPGTSLSVGDLAIATGEVFGDEGVSTPEGFLDLQSLGFPTVVRSGKPYYNAFPVDGELLAKLSPEIEAFAVKRSRKALCGTFVTVSACCGTLTAGVGMAGRTGGLCENMEGAAVAQVCALYNIPFLEMRGISNLVEDRDTARWDLRSAAAIAQEATLHLLPFLSGR